MNSQSFFRLRASRCGVALTCLAALSCAAQAQTDAPQAESATKSRPGAMAAQPAQPSSFTSAFSNYKPYQEQAVGDWKKANDEVGRIGGWRAYTREANEPAPAAPQARPPAPRGEPAAKDPHAGHVGQAKP